jgi:hypothetical protein
VTPPLRAAHPTADTGPVTDDRRASLKRAAGWALVAGLTVAALTAVGALLAGDLDDTSLRVILTSIGFAVASSTAATGAAQRYRRSAGLAALGTATAILAGLAFALLAAGLWTNRDDWGSEGIWRAFGCSGLLAIAGAHACLVLGARRRTDSEAVTALAFASLALAALDTLGGLLPISGLMDEVDDTAAKLLAATLVLLVLTSLLQPILRRLQPASAGPRETSLEHFAAEVEAAAGRIEELNRGPGSRAPEIRREAERLRRLARSFQG